MEPGSMIWGRRPVAPSTRSSSSSGRYSALLYAGLGAFLVVTGLCIASWGLQAQVFWSPRKLGWGLRGQSSCNCSAACGSQLDRLREQLGEQAKQERTQWEQQVNEKATQQQSEQQKQHQEQLEKERQQWQKQHKEELEKERQQWQKQQAEELEKERQQWQKQKKEELEKERQQQQQQQQEKLQTEKQEWEKQVRERVAAEAALREQREREGRKNEVQQAQVQPAAQAAQAAPGGAAKPAPVGGGREWERPEVVEEQRRLVEQQTATFMKWLGTNVTVSDRLGQSASEKPTRDEVLADLTATSLDPDLKVWRARPKMPTSTLFNELHQYQVTRRRPDSKRVMLYRDGEFYYLNYNLSNASAPPTWSTICTEPCYFTFRNFGKEFKEWLNSTRVALPNNVVFYFNSGDLPECPRGACPAPVLSFSKTRDEDDVLVPLVGEYFVDRYVSFPWEKKTNWAFIRATAHCPGRQFGIAPMGEVLNPRLHLVHLSTLYPGLLNASLLEGYTGYDVYGNGGHLYRAGKAEPMGPEGSRLNFSKNAYVSLQEHARHKFLINADGVGPSYRLSKIMRVDSVIVKQVSGLHEYFTRALKEWVHYIPILKDNITDVVSIMREYTKPERDAQLRALAQASNLFADKYTSREMRALYWGRVLGEYKALFTDMDDYIERTVWPQVQASLKAEAEAKAEAGKT